MRGHLSHSSIHWKPNEVSSYRSLTNGTLDGAQFTLEMTGLGGWSGTTPSVAFTKWQPPTMPELLIVVLRRTAYPSEATYGPEMRLYWPINPAETEVVTFVDDLSIGECAVFREPSNLPLPWEMRIESSEAGNDVPVKVGTAARSGDI